MIAAYLPGVTAGIGAMLAGHITNHRNLQRAEFSESKKQAMIVDVKTPEMYYRQERLFLIAGGVIKVLYYVGAFVLLFVLTELTPFGTGRGGLTFILKPVFTAESGDFMIIIGSVIFSGCLSFILLISLTEKIIDFIDRINVRAVYSVILVLVFILIYFMGGGIIGVGVSLITTCIGMIPVFYGCRRSHCMAVLLVPIMLNMAGHGDIIVKILKLV
jgi:putative membrane protein